ncbi:MAG: hypothetical protein COA84_15150 [Robiginitomaculum sp.]|nr:MAG: hypothetical protein COA84_15150 [Robiginitomaculum sp.]
MTLRGFAATDSDNVTKLRPKPNRIGRFLMNKSNIDKNTPAGRWPCRSTATRIVRPYADAGLTPQNYILPIAPKGYQMSAINLRMDLMDFERGLTRLEKKQMPFAASLALNATVLDVQKNAIARLSKDLDRPTPFTKRGVFVKRSTKQNLFADVGFKDIQAGYLKWQQDGGVRRPKQKAIVVPVANGAGFKRNKYGNMSRNAVKRLLAKPNVFSGKVKGVGGIWLRPKRSKRRGGGVGTVTNVKAPKLLAAYRSSVKYMPTMDFQGDAYKTAKVRFPHHLERTFKQALATSR